MNSQAHDFQCKDNNSHDCDIALSTLFDFVFIFVVCAEKDSRK